SVGLVTDMLDREGVQYDVERKQIVKHGEARTFTHIHIYDRFNFELTVYPEDKAHYVFRSSVTGKAIERASVRELEELLEREYPGINMDQEVNQESGRMDPYQMYRILLLPLEDVQQPVRYHPE